MSESYDIIDHQDSPSGKSMVVRSCIYHLSPRDQSMSDDSWHEKLQAKANLFGSYLDAVTV